MKTFALIALAFSLTAPAFAGGEISFGNPGPTKGKQPAERNEPGSEPESILGHSMTQGILLLLNEKNRGSCQLDEEKDIKWMCTGAIPQVKEPTILPNGCGFSFKITCENETVQVMGSRTSYSLVSPKPNKVKPTSSIVTFYGIRKL